MPDRASKPLIELVRLRDVVTDDLPVLYKYQLDPDSVQMAGVKPRSSAEFDAHWAKILSDQSVVSNAILADELLVGTISCFKMDGENSVGYWIGKEHWGKGIATRALTLLLEQVSTRPLHARVARANTASICVLERCGFEITGYQHSPATQRFLACEEAIFVLR